MHGESLFPTFTLLRAIAEPLLAATLPPSGCYASAALALSLAGTRSSATGTFTDIVTIKGVTQGTGTLSMSGLVGIN